MWIECVPSCVWSVERVFDVIIMYIWNILPKQDPEIRTICLYIYLYVYFLCCCQTQCCIDWRYCETFACLLGGWNSALILMFDSSVLEFVPTQEGFGRFEISASWEIDRASVGGDVMILPPRHCCFDLCVKRNRRLAIKVMVTQNRTLWRRPREERQRHRHRHIDPNLPHLDFVFKLASRSTARGKEGYAVAHRVSVDECDSLVQRTHEHAT